MFKKDDFMSLMGWTWNIVFTTIFPGSKTQFVFFS